MSDAKSTDLFKLTKHESQFLDMFRENQKLSIIRDFYRLNRNHIRHMVNGCSALSWAAFHGDLKKVKWLVSKGGCTDRYLNPHWIQSSFTSACDQGHQKVAEWLYRNLRIDPHFADDAAFRFTVKNNQLSVAKWLWSLTNGKIDLHGAVQPEIINRVIQN